MNLAGTVKILDTASFPIARGFAAALFRINSGAMRGTSDEWDYLISRQGSLAVYAAPRQ